ncbi:MAG: sortase [Patescibacteria group bacterium]
MIDFLNPRSKIVRFGSALGMLSIVILAFGVYLTVDKVTEYRSAKTIAGIDNLPSGDYLLENVNNEPSDLEDLLQAVQNYQAAFIPEQVEELDVDPITEVELVESTTPTNTEETTPAPVVAGVQYDAETETNQNNNTEVVEDIPQENMIVIPRMGVRAVLNEGSTADTLREGVWRMPQASTPDQGGNTVITAHRYLYRPPDPRTFFLIDKMVVGDTFTVYWNGEEYNYRVRETKIVEPTEISILYNTPTNQITLFSCTPLFTSDQRLVVIADEI